MSISTVDPSGGPIFGGTGLIITGSGFADILSVSVGPSQLADVVVVGPREITGHTASTPMRGPANVVVRSGTRGRTVCLGCFVYYSHQDGEFPWPVSGLTGATRLSAGSGHTCAVEADGEALCWGANWAGQLGDGSETNPGGPVTVLGAERFTTVRASAGLDRLASFGHSCGLAETGAAYCWGRNSNGQLGDGTAVGSVVPLAVAGSLVFGQLAVGLEHTCGATGVGAAYCWGRNADGRLGDASTVDRMTPTAVAGGVRFTRLTAGGLVLLRPPPIGVLRVGHSCGLTDEGVAYCWGDNTFGQLGHGPGTGSVAPVAAATNLAFVTIAAGATHTCGLTASGEAYCWGWNLHGELGDSSTAMRNTPTVVHGGLHFNQLTAGGWHTCGLTSSGNAYCWGWNDNGQLGDGSTTWSSAPVPVAGGLTFDAISAGGFHSCGHTSDDRIFCWGWNQYGQLGRAP